MIAFRVALLRYSMALLLASAVLPLTLRAQVPFADCERISDSNATILITSETRLSLDGQPLPIGTVIAVIGDARDCRGSVVWRGAGVSLNIRGDDSQTEDQDGYAADEPLRFAIWNPVTKALTYMVKPDFGGVAPYRSSGTYLSDALFQLRSLEGHWDVAPEPTYPRDMALLSAHEPVELGWSGIVGASLYEVEVWTTLPGADSMRVFQQEVAASSVLLPAVAISGQFRWRVRVLEGSGRWSETRHFETSLVADAQDEARASSHAPRAYPNPADLETTFGFHLESPTHVRLDIYDMLGRHLEKLWEGALPAGLHERRWRTSHLTPGHYLFVLSGEGQRKSVRLVIAG